jgi:hypothetical protein
MEDPEELAERFEDYSLFYVIKDNEILVYVDGQLGLPVDPIKYAIYLTKQVLALREEIASIQKE